MKCQYVFSETPLSNLPTNLILFTDIESPIYSGVTLTPPPPPPPPPSIAHMQGVSQNQFHTAQFSKLILKSLSDDTSFFFNYLQFILYQPSINYQLAPFLLCWGFNPICHGHLSIPYLSRGRKGVNMTPPPPYYFLIGKGPGLQTLHEYIPLQELSISLPGVRV